MQLFIALTFAENDLNYQKINNFRKRFDEKISRSPLVLMTLMSPFKINDKSASNSYSNLVECLRDDLDTYLSGFEKNFSIIFNSMDFAAGRNGVIYLKPKLPEELFFFQEAAIHELKSMGATFNRDEKKLKNNQKNTHTFLPIGRSDSDLTLQVAIEKAQHEFSMPFSLQAKSISLFEKLPGLWNFKDTLFKFEEEKSSIQEDFKSPMINFRYTL